jgi:ubiquinone/menaquinone biosynthesis C-methylase UbiE
MEPLRKPFQGIWNIIRFNRHFYLLAFLLIICIVLFGQILGSYYITACYWLAILIIVTVSASIIVSFYVYDISALYKLTWLQLITITSNSKIINVNAGFDEVSMLLHNKFPGAELIIYDFYDPLKHTEVSIKRARKAYPPYNGTQQISTSNLPLTDRGADHIFLILSAHEIRDEEERNMFFKELNRVLAINGKIVITEHLRDVANFLAYNIGFLHFMSKASWYKTFESSGFSIYKEIKITPFITNFILEKNGNKS